VGVGGGDETAQPPAVSPIDQALAAASRIDAWHPDGVQEFDVVLEAAERGPGCAIRLPFDAKAVLGSGRAPVWASINGHEAFRTTIAVYGGVSWIGLRRDQRQAFGVGVGDRVRATVARDDAPREVEVPSELAEALAGAPDAAQTYKSLSYTHRKEYARWVGEAKKAQTRTARAVKAVTLLNQGVPTPG
jgi:Bacteriocin-protection, YdeI or OmpD-Associated/Domain of unknown function (DUF1905)